MRSLRLGSYAALVVVPALCLSTASRASAVITVVTPGEQNTYSGENSCSVKCDPFRANCNTKCDAAHWLHYPELIQQALGAGYAVQNDGDGGSIIGCDAATQGAALGGSFCGNNTLYKASTVPSPNIAIIGPFGEHDQRALKNNMTLNTQPAFEAAYEALVQDYLKLGAKVYIMTPIDSQPWGGTDPLPNNEDLVKTIMVPAALAVAQKHSLTVIDTYTAITGTPALTTMYYAADGQVNSAAQQKMAELIEAALMSGSGGSGGTGGMAGASGAGGAGGATSSGGAGAGGTSGGGAGGSTAGTGGVIAGSAGAAPSAGSAGATSGVAGSAGAVAAAGGAAGSGTAPNSGSSDNSSGCAIAAVGERGFNAGFLLGVAGLLGLSRRRRQRV